MNMYAPAIDAKRPIVQELEDVFPVRSSNARVADLLV